MDNHSFKLEVSTACRCLKSPRLGTYIHPPHHGHLQVMLMVINNQLTSLTFHVNWPFYSWDKTVSNLDLENPKPRSWVIVGPSLQMIWFLFISYQLDQRFLRYWHKVYGGLWGNHTFPPTFQHVSNHYVFVSENKLKWTKYHTDIQNCILTQNCVVTQSSTN